MCLLAALDSQGIVVKCTAAIFFRTVDCRNILKKLELRKKNLVTLFLVTPLRRYPFRRYGVYLQPLMSTSSLFGADFIGIVEVITINKA